jgi:coenzyme Q-binding protein COQ10
LRQRLTRILPYQPEQLFDLVGDVERYPEFIKWITELRAWNRRESADGAVLLDAEARVAFKMVRERFATRVRLDATALAIDVDLISGPFRRLKNRWRFRLHPMGTELEFAIDFVFGPRFFEVLLAANFEMAVARLIAAFEDRARALYGDGVRAPNEAARGASPGR